MYFRKYELIFKVLKLVICRDIDNRPIHELAFIRKIAFGYVQTKSSEMSFCFTIASMQAF